MVHHLECRLENPAAICGIYGIFVSTCQCGSCCESGIDALSGRLLKNSLPCQCCWKLTQSADVLPMHWGTTGPFSSICALYWLSHQRFLPV